MISSVQVDDALLTLPSDGWTSCWTGRRDRALLVLSQMAGLSFQAIAELVVADVEVADGVAVIRTPGGATTLRSAADGRICGPCALARWLHVLDLTAIYPNPGVVTAAIARAAPLTANSPHLCEGRTEVCEQTRSMPVLPNIDQWGPMTPGSKSAGEVSSAANPHAADPISVGRQVPTRRRPAGVLHPEPQRRFAPAQVEKDVPVQSTQPGSARTRLRHSPVFPRHLDLVRSNYSWMDREHAVAPSALPADGLEGRARALLEQSAQVANKSYRVPQSAALQHSGTV